MIHSTEWIIDSGMDDPFDRMDHRFGVDGEWIIIPQPSSLSPQPLTLNLGSRVALGLRSTLPASLSLTAMPSRLHRISFDLRSEAAQGLVSTGVGDGLGIP